MHLNVCRFGFCISRGGCNVFWGRAYATSYEFLVLLFFFLVFAKIFDGGFIIMLRTFVRLRAHTP